MPASGVFLRLYPALNLCYKPIITPEIIPLPEDRARPKRPSNAGAHFPAPDYEHQDSFFDNAFNLLQDAIAKHVFPGCSLAVTNNGKLIALKSLGHFTYEPDSPEVLPESIFDLASLTKVLATTTMAMLLYERGLLDLELPVAAIIPQFAADDSRRPEVTLRMLLAHSSGLPAYEKLFLQAHSRDQILRAAIATPLSADPGVRAEYSDIGFIVLGIALEKIADETLDRFCQREIFGPLGMVRTSFNPSNTWRASISPTADDHTFRKRTVQGEVQDENASVLGGIAGHAGLFATTHDVALFAHAMLSGGRPILRPETLALFTKRQSAPEGTSRALGWDTPSPPSQSGKYFSAHSFGHLGYTGTSLWIDPARQLSITLLTNRTLPDCSNHAIKQVRPAFHDAVIESLEKKS